MGEVRRPADDLRAPLGSAELDAPEVTRRRWDGAVWHDERVAVAREEPLQIRVGRRALATLMRTPGADFELVRGFLWSEGVVTHPRQVASVRHCEAGEGIEEHENVVVVRLSPDAPALDAGRAFLSSASCGICGRASIDDVVARIRALSTDRRPRPWAPEAVTLLGERVRAEQRLFDRTGGVHAAGLFSADGQRLCIYEDVGRHNAVDKILGWVATRSEAAPEDLSSHALFVSGRVSFDIVSKAVIAGVGTLVAVSAPSSLSVALARACNLTLIAFARDRAMSVYADPSARGETS